MLLRAPSLCSFKTRFSVSVISRLSILVRSFVVFHLRVVLQDAVKACQRLQVLDRRVFRQFYKISLPVKMEFHISVSVCSVPVHPRAARSGPSCRRRCSASQSWEPSTPRTTRSVASRSPCRRARATPTSPCTRQGLPAPRQLPYLPQRLRHLVPPRHPAGICEDTSGRSYPSAQKKSG